jgi:hypothetical protein
VWLANRLPGSKLVSGVPLQALHDPFGLRVGALAKEPVHLELATKCGVDIGGPSATGVQTPLAIPHQHSRQPAERPQTACDAPQHIGGFFTEDKRTSADSGISEACNDHPGPAGLAVANRHMLRGLPQIELTDLPRPIDGALICPACRKQRPDLAQVVIDDRLAAIKPERRDQLPDPHARQFGIRREQLVDLIPIGIELRSGRCPPIDRRTFGAQRPPDRVAIDPKPSRELFNRHPADEVLTPQLSPTLHVKHALLPDSNNMNEAKFNTPPGACATTRQGGAFSNGAGG